MFYIYQVTDLWRKQLSEGHLRYGNRGFWWLIWRYLVGIMLLTRLSLQFPKRWTRRMWLWRVCVFRINKFMHTLHYNVNSEACTWRHAEKYVRQNCKFISCVWSVHILVFTARASNKTSRPCHVQKTMVKVIVKASSEDANVTSPETDNIKEWSCWGSVPLARVAEGRKH